MKPSELYRFIKENINDENKCIQQIGSCFLCEQLEGIKATDLIRRNKEFIRIDEKYSARRFDPEVGETKREQPEEPTKTINAGLP